jgi:hypothetical protein
VNSITFSLRVAPKNQGDGVPPKPPVDWLMTPTTRLWSDFATFEFDSLSLVSLHGTKPPIVAAKGPFIA